VGSWDILGCVTNDRFGFFLFPQLLLEVLDVGTLGHKFEPFDLEEAGRENTATDGGSGT
jgi:hypothetical protein